MQLHLGINFPSVPWKLGHQSLYTLAKGFCVQTNSEAWASNTPHPPLLYPRHQQHVNEPNYLQGWGRGPHRRALPSKEPSVMISTPLGDGWCCHRAVKEEASLEMPCREETVPFQCENSKIAANKKPSYCDTSIQTPTRIPWQAVWLLTSLFLLFLHRARTIAHMAIQRCSDGEGQQGSA